MTNIDHYITILLQSKILPQNHVQKICTKLKQILLHQSNIVQLRAPITICGDIHGQYTDLLQIFKIAGNAPDTNYLFLGDYVDRGVQSVETFLLLMCLKIKYPSRITLLRGNHESRQVTQVYGLYDQCQKKYGNTNVWSLFVSVFDFMPISALVQKKFFCMHGGLSPSATSLQQIKLLNRRVQVPTDGPVCDLLWSDPDQRQGWWASNRGAGYLFGADITKAFHHHNQTEMIVRAHQLMISGYESTHQNKLMTVFSAPNYCYRCGNQGGMMEISENGSISTISFDCSPQIRSPDKFQKRIPDYFL